VLCLRCLAAGVPDARQRAAEGIDAYVLKYRLPATPSDPARFADGWNELLRSATRLSEKAPTLPDVPYSVDDLAQAILRVRTLLQGRHGATGTVGAVGFSAGSYLLQALMSRPGAPGLDHLALLYGPMQADVVRNKYPATFVALANDDPLFGRHGFGLVTALQSHAPSVELHLYEDGGHGFGAVRQGTASDRWIQDYLAWLSRQ
jgi:dienelactone hydrolase